VSIANLKLVLEQALPSDIAAGLDSYAKYNRIMCRLAGHCATTTGTASGVFAALSPNNDYHGNLRDAHTLLQAARKNMALSEFSVSTYGQNKRKAWQIAQGADPLKLITARKTRSFFLNIVDPADPVPVTVDGHMLNIWRRRKDKLVGLRAPASLYDQVAEDTRTVAREFGCLPSQMQGILWLTHRRMHGIKSNCQLEFWDVDLLAARLGFHAA
jgi:hypothetical protein